MSNDKNDKPDAHGMNKITSEEELIPGEYYWCRGKTKYNDGSYAKPSVEICGIDQGLKYLSKYKWWLDMALKNYDVYGPVPRVKAFS